MGTRIVAPTHALEHGNELKFGDVTLRIHHYGVAHTPYDLAVEVLGDKLTCVGDLAMDRRIANMDDGSYLGTLKAYDALEKNAASTIWVPGHGEPSGEVLKWNRELFEGIYRPCEQAVKDGLPAGRSQGRWCSRIRAFPAGPGTPRGTRPISASTSASPTWRQKPPASDSRAI